MHLYMKYLTMLKLKLMLPCPEKECHTGKDVSNEYHKYLQGKNNEHNISNARQLLCLYIQALPAVWLRNQTGLNMLLYYREQQLSRHEISSYMDYTSCTEYSLCCVQCYYCYCKSITVTIQICEGNHLS